MSSISEEYGVGEEFVADQYLLALVTWRQTVLHLIHDLSKNTSMFLGFRSFYSLLESLFMEDANKMLEYCRNHIKEGNRNYELFILVEEDLKFLTATLDNFYNNIDA